MPQKIFQKNYHDQIAYLNRNNYKVVVDNSQSEEQITFEGRLWSKLTTYEKSLYSKERFLLFMCTLFEIICQYLAATNDLQKHKIEQNWKIATTGKIEQVVLYRLINDTEPSLSNQTINLSPVEIPIEQISPENAILHILSAWSSNSNSSNVAKIIFNSHGMSIHIADDPLAEKLRQRDFYLDLHEDKIDGTTYPYRLKVKRRNIRSSLLQLGMGAESANFCYQQLIRQGLIHSYVPSSDTDPLVALNLSLSKIIPNQETHIPYTAMHPNGWLSIRLPHDADKYVELLKDYLEVAPVSIFPIKYTNNGINYNQEIRIDAEDLPSFLNRIELCRGNGDIEFLHRLKTSCPSLINFQTNVSMSDVQINIAKSIASLKPPGLGNCSKEIPNVMLGYGNRLKIEIPPSLQVKQIAITKKRELSFGEFLSHTYGINGILCPSGKYTVTLKKKDAAIFLEKDLNLRDLPSRLCRLKGIKTFYNKLFARHLLSRTKMRGTIKGWSLRNPDLTIPPNIPQLLGEQILDKANFLLKNHPKQHIYIQVIRDTMLMAQAEPLGPMLIDFFRYVVTPIENSTISITDAQRRAALIAIGETATACWPGRFSKVQFEFSCLIQPESKDSLRTLLAKEIEIAKNNILAELFRGVLHSVHTVSAAQVSWGEELGLDITAGNRDRYISIGRNYVTPESKKRFKELCEHHLQDNLFNTLSVALDDETSDLLHKDLYRDSLYHILLAKGFTKDQINGDLDEETFLPISGEMQKLLPIDREGKTLLTKNALELMLIDIGFLYA